MIEIKEDDELVILFKNFYKCHNRLPTATELAHRTDIPFPRVVFKHFKSNSLDEIYEAICGIKTTFHIIEEYIIAESENRTRPVLYFNSRKIAKSKQISTHKIGQHLRIIAKKQQPIAGYIVTLTTEKCQSIKKYKAEKIEK